MTFRQPVITNVGRRNPVQSQVYPNTSVTTLLGQDALPAVSTGLPNPWGKPPLNTGMVNGFNVNLEGAAPPAPPKTQYDRPNPVLRQWSPVNLTFTNNTSPELRALVFTIPQGKQSYTNPILRTVQRQDFIPTWPLTFRTFIPPVVSGLPHNLHFLADMGSMMSR